MPKRSKELIRDLFADRRKALVRYLASRLPNEEDAHDLAQEAYLRLLRLEKLDLVRDPEAYLFRMAKNLVHEHWLKVHPESVSDGIDPDGLPGPMAPTAVLAGQSQAIDALGRVLRLLPPMQQRVVLMHRRDGLTYGEIAEVLNISSDMVKKYLRKGLARCREYMRRYHDY